MKRLVLMVLAASAATPALAAGAANFMLVNGTGATLAELSIRRVGTQDWKSLGTPPTAGAKSSMTFKDPDCAFDIRANVQGIGVVTWTGVNLCGAKSVISEPRRFGRRVDRLWPVTGWRLVGGA